MSKKTINLLDPNHTRVFSLPRDRFAILRGLSFLSAVTLTTLYIVYSASGANTTIGNNISTSGTLTVGGISRLSSGLYASSTLQASGTTTLYDTLSIAGAVSASSTFQVTGNTRIYGDLTVDGTTSLGGISLSNPSFTGNTSVQQDLFVYGGDINLGTGSATSTLTSANGKLGVGSTSPSQTLAVQGNALFSGNITSVANITATGTLSLTGTSGTSTIASGQGFTIGSSQFVVQQGSGNVGIGTSTPSQKLYVEGRSFFNNNAYNFITVNSQLSDAYLRLAGGGVEKWFIRNDFDDSHKFQIGNEAMATDNTAAVLTILQSGNVGIGTTTPSKTFSVQGDSLFSGNLSVANVTATGTLNVTGLTTLGNASTTQISSTGSSYFATSGGSVGIASTSPLAQLSVEMGTNPFALWVGDSGTSTPALAVSGAGNVSIGTVSHPQKLAVYGDSDGEIGIVVGNTNTGASSVASFVMDGQGNNFRIKNWGDGTANANLTEFHSSATGARFAFSGGNVGIGTTTPNWNFQTAGTRPFAVLSDTSAGIDAKHWFTSSQGGNFYVGTSTDSLNATSTYLTIANGGNVGIGTTTPTQKFNVDGPVLFGNQPWPSVSAARTGRMALTQTSGNAALFFFDDTAVAANNTFGTIAFEGRKDDTGPVYDVFAQIKAAKENANQNDRGGYLSFITSSNSLGTQTEQLRITSLGLVGIGTTTPSQTLAVQGNALFSGNLSVANITATGTLNVTGATTLSSTLSTGTSTLNNLIVTNTSSSTFAGPISNTSGNLIVAPTGTSNNLLLNPYGGNVGIGSTTPGFPLSVTKTNGLSAYFDGGTTDASFYMNQGSVSGPSTVAGIRTNSGSPAFNAKNGGAIYFNRDVASADVIFQYNSGVSNSLVVSGSSGNVGIGTTTPMSLFSLSSSEPIITIAGTGAATAKQIRFVGPAGSATVSNWQVGADAQANDAFTFTPSTAAGGFTFSSPALSILNTGSVGIGTATPSTTFAVQGNALFSGNISSVANIMATGTLTVTGTSGTSTIGSITIGPNGKIGIGTTTPNIANFEVATRTIAFNSGADGSLGPWATTTSMQSGVTLHTSVASNGYIYVMGGLISGCNANGCNETFYTKVNSDGSLGSWATSTNLIPGVHFQHSSVTANGYIYILGGYDGQSAVYYAKINRDGDTSAWSTNINPLPYGIWRASAATANGYIYVIGGTPDTGGSTTTVSYAKLNSDGSTSSWASTTALTVASIEHSSVAANGYVYVLGDGTNKVYYAKINSDGTLNNWRQNSNNLPTATSLTSAVVASGYIYVVGGYSTSGVYYAKLNSDGSIGPWSTTNMPAYRNGHTSVVVNGYVYVIGGKEYPGSTNMATVSYASTARTQIAGNLDLIGLASSTVSDLAGDNGSVGGSIFAGNIFSQNRLEVGGNSSLWGGLNVNGLFSLTASSSAPQNQSIFSIQNATGTAPLFTVQYDGKVGIGTSSLTAVLGLQKPSTGSIFNISNNLAGDLLTVNNSGQLGLGTTSPSQTLAVQGNALFSGNISSVANITATGTATIGGSTNSNQLTIREHANQAQATAPFVIVGRDGSTALEIRVGTSSQSNTLIGLDAGKLITVGGTANTALGLSALEDLTTGDSNVAVGNSALANIATTNMNTAIGSTALYQTTSGYQNTAVGAEASYYNISGINNVAVGQGALTNSRTGNNNVAIGEAVLNYNGSATNTTAVGFQAGFGVAGTSNQNNSLFGYSAGYGLSTGSNNLLFGYQAGDALTTGSNNIIVGYDIDAPSNTGSNQLSIGNLLFGTGIDGTGTTISSGNIGIGTTTPSTKFAVQGNALFSGNLSLANLAATGSISITANTSGIQTNSLFIIQNATGTAPIFTALYNGNIGIGTSTPNAQLNIFASSTVNTTALKVDTDGALGPFASSSVSLPGVRKYHGTAAANGYVYVVGGGNASNATQSSVYYSKLNSDGSINSWQTNMNSLPAGGAFAPSSFVANGYIYSIGGGASINDDSVTTQVYYAKLNKDGSTGSWKINANTLPVAGRFEHSTVAANGYVYVMGGCQGNCGSATSSVVYAKLNGDGSIGIWASTTAMAAPRLGAASVVANGYVYVISGYSGGSKTDVYYAKINNDGSLGNWSINSYSLPTSGSYGEGVGATVVNGYVYVGGGGVAVNAPISYAKLNSDGSTGPWRTTSILPSANAAYGGFVGIVTVNGYIYAIGQYTNLATFYASTARTQIAGNLDLIGLASSTLSDFGGDNGSVGGSIFAGDIFSAGKLTVMNNTQLMGGLAVNDLFSLTASTSAPQDSSIFSIQNATSSSPLFTVQYNGNIGIGTSTPNAQLNIFASATTSALNITTNGALSAWATSTNFITERRIQSGVAANGYIYTIGGRSTSNNVIKSIEYSKINSDGSPGVWATSTNPLPLNTEQQTSHVANGYLYAIGGETTIGGTARNTVYYAKLRGDGTNDSWQTDYLPIGRKLHSSAVANGFLYVFGGIDESGSATSSVIFARLNSDGSVGSWASTTALAVADYQLAAVVANGYIYTFAGDTSPTTKTYYARINNDGTLGNWTAGTTITGTHGDLGQDAVVLNGYVYLIGGGPSANSKDVSYAKLNSDGSIGTWKDEATFPENIGNAITVTTNGYIYIIGGSLSNGALPSSKVFYTSAARTTISGSLDLLKNTNLPLTGWAGDNGSVGGAIYAGSIFSQNNLEVSGNTQLWNGLGVNGIFSLSASTSAPQDSSIFSIQNATGTAPLFTVQYDGKVGIGTSSLTAVLGLQKPSTGSLFNISNNLAGDLLTVNNSGQLGLGTTSPSQTLAVQGNALFSGDLTLANLTATGTLTLSGTSGTSTIASGQGFT
ncbi:MAG: hypothetical protein HZB99_00140, partial [Candidatus Harrisonbacteria bacterium]|nr:hypothetical protein [Candidatus Harrisonbacteria bacterium]